MKVYTEAGALLKKANDTFEPLSPLIKWLEKSMLVVLASEHSYIEPQDQKSVSFDRKNLRDVNKELESLYN
jgi:hypothetical protein